MNYTLIIINAASEAPLACCGGGGGGGSKVFVTTQDSDSDVNVINFVQKIKGGGGVA